MRVEWNRACQNDSLSRKSLSIFGAIEFWDDFGPEWDLRRFYEFSLVFVSVRIKNSIWLQLWRHLHYGWEAFRPEFEWVDDPIGGGGYIEGLAGFPLFPWVNERLEVMPVNEFEYELMNHQLLRGWLGPYEPCREKSQISGREKKWRVRIFRGPGLF